MAGRSGPAVRPPSRASSAPTKVKSRAPCAFHHSIGRVSARLLLILTHQPVGRLSGGIDPGVGAQRPFGTAKHSERRCSEANRRRCPPGSIPERRNPSLSEGRTSGQSVLVTFGWAGIPASAKVTRRKGGTLTSHHHNNGYSPKNTRQTKRAPEGALSVTTTIKPSQQWSRNQRSTHHP
jgi:hypothetical protein